MSSMFASRCYYDRNSKKVQKLNNLLLRLVCKEGLPFSLVDSKHFRDLVSELDPRYSIPSRTTLSRSMVPNAYEIRKTSKVNELKELCNTEFNVLNISFTTDTWTSVSNDGYMSLTAHYIDDNFQPHNCCLMVRNVHGSHTAQNLSDELTTALTDWSIPLPSEQCYVFMVTDNGRNMVNAAKMAKFKWKGCFAHTLQLVVEDALKDSKVSGLKTILAKCRSIVEHFKHSTVSCEKLRKVQEQLKLPQHILTQDVSTRWNSQYDMQQRLVEQKDAVTLCLTSIDAVPNLNVREWTTAQEMIDVLKPFYDLTVMMCAEKYSTLSMVIPLVNGVMHLLINLTGGLDIFRGLNFH